MIGLVFKALGMIGILFMCGGVLKKKDPMFLVSGILLLIYSIFLGDMVFIILECIFIIVTIYSMIKKVADNKKESQEKKIVSKFTEKETLEDYLNLCHLYSDLLENLNNDNEVKYELDLLSLRSVIHRMKVEMGVESKEDLIRVSKKHDIVLLDGFKYI